MNTKEITKMSTAFLRVCELSHLSTLEINKKFAIWRLSWYTQLQIRMEDMESAMGEVEDKLHDPYMPTMEVVVGKDKCVNTQDWISVKDKLPKKAAWVLVSVGGAVNCVFLCPDGSWEDWTKPINPNVLPSLEITHWMYIPAPPEEEDCPNCGEVYFGESNE